MALVETNMVKVQEVFLPYVVMKNRETMFDQIEKRGYTALEFKS